MRDIPKILQIIPAPGWRAANRHKGERGDQVVVTERFEFRDVACFALLEFDDGTRTVEPMTYSADLGTMVEVENARNVFLVGPGDRDTDLEEIAKAADL